jgi:energy-coupling factor transporter ATP-binding protein EcfA2
VHANDVKRAFAHLVIDSDKLRQFGTALNSGSSIFLYGPPGTGKTTVAETLSRVISQDAVWIPYAVEVEGEIITVYDAAIHKRMAESEPADRDERWVLCQRPAGLGSWYPTLSAMKLRKGWGTQSSGNSGLVCPAESRHLASGVWQNLIVR